MLQTIRNWFLPTVDVVMSQFTSTISKLEEIEQVKTDEQLEYVAKAEEAGLEASRAHAISVKLKDVFTV
jgi:hypothetical protein